MTRPPPNPDMPRRPGDPEGQAAKGQGLGDRRDRATEIDTGQPGDSDVNTEIQGRFGNLGQNLTTRWKTPPR